MGEEIMVNMFGIVFLILLLLVVVGVISFAVNCEKNPDGDLKIKIIPLICVALPIICAIFVIGNNMFKEYKEDRYDETWDMHFYTEKYLNVKGECKVYYNKVDRKSTEYGERAETLVYIYYYNFYNDNEVTYDELIKQYEYFCQGKRKSKYEDLTKYINFMKTANNITPTVENIPLGRFWFFCGGYMGYDFDNTEKWTDEKVYEICDLVMKNRERIYPRIMADDFFDEMYERHARSGYPYLYEFNFNENAEIVEVDGEKILKEKSGAILYLKDCVLDYMTEEELSCVYKIEINEDSERDYLFGSIGENQKKNKKEMMSYRAYSDYNVRITLETDDQVIFESDHMRWVFDYVGKDCAKITVEITD